MMRSLYSAISGLSGFQTKMDVLGNNIANVNTTGFKASRVTFQTALSQVMKGAIAPNGNYTSGGTPPTQGGTNPVQIGLGQTYSTDQVMTQGSSETTGNKLDMMLQGDGFFVLKNGAETVYTRAGGFSLDASGDLVDPASGAIVQGAMDTGSGLSPDMSTSATTPDQLVPIHFQIGETDPTGGSGTLSDYSIDQSGTITGVFTDNTNTPPTSYTAVIGKIAVAQFPNNAGLLNVGGNFSIPTNNSGSASVWTPGQSGYPTLVSGALEMSNVNLSQEFTDMIIAQRGFQANARVITVGDSLLQELVDLKRQ